MDLQISSQFGQIGIDYTYPDLYVSTKPADIQIKQNPPEIEIRTDYPQVQIDLSEVYSELGYKSVVPFASEHASRGVSSLLNGIQRVAQEGDTVARSIGQGRKITADIAWGRVFDKAEFNVDVLPHTPPEIWFTGGLDIDAKQGSVRVDSKPALPDTEFTPGQVKVYLKKEPGVDIRAVGGNIDLVI